MDYTKMICRICLNISDQIASIGNELTNMLKLIIPVINLDLTLNPQICQNCSISLIILHEFKSSSVKNLEGENLQRSTQLNILDDNFVASEVHMEKSSDIPIKTEKLEKCNFCQESFDRFETIGTEETEHLKLMVKEYFSQMEALTTTLISCKQCLEQMEKLESFVATCLNTENKIKNYRFIQKLSSDSPVSLFEVFKYTHCVKMENEVADSNLALFPTVLKKSPLSSISSYSSSPLKSELVYDEPAHFEDIDIKPISIKAVIKNENLEESAETGKSDRRIPPQSRKGPSIIKYNCQKKLRKNPVALQCNECKYQAQNKREFKAHMKIHADPLQITMYHCELCNYKTKYKFVLQRHEIVHKDNSEVMLYKCNLCSYNTRYKSYLKIHFLQHKSPSEIKMHKCHFCCYESKYKSNVNEHAMCHKKPSELIKYKCNLCPFETVRKWGIRPHMKVHQDPNEVQMFTCQICSYETRHKRCLNVHYSKHKTSFDHKCDICPFKTKRKDSLKNHMNIHKNPADLKFFKCELCKYSSRRRDILRRHMKVHKDIIEY